MADLVSIVSAIINFASWIKKKVDAFQRNKEDCRKVSELVATVRTVAESLRKNLKEEDGGVVGGAMVDDALKALKQALERAWGVVTDCQENNTCFRANDIARKLHRVYLDVSLNLIAVGLAYSAYNASKLGDIHGILVHINRVDAALRADVAADVAALRADVAADVAALRADVAALRADVAEFREMVAALPVALRQQVETLVQSYSDSTNDDASYHYYQNESIRETKKTGDVVRYPTYTVPCDPRRHTPPTMSSSVIAVRDVDHLWQVAEDARVHGKLLVLEFMGSVSYRSMCEFTKQILESIAANCKRNNVRADFCTVDVDNKKFKKLAEDFEVQVLPTFWMILNYDGYECVTGTDKEELTKCIYKYAPK